jgi:hypothetical protein
MSKVQLILDSLDSLKSDVIRAREKAQKFFKIKKFGFGMCSYVAVFVARELKPSYPDVKVMYGGRGSSGEVHYWLVFPSSREWSDPSNDIFDRSGHGVTVGSMDDDYYKHEYIEVGPRDVESYKGNPSFDPDILMAPRR